MYPIRTGLRAFHIRKIFTVKAQPQTAVAKYIDASLFSLIPPSPALSHWREEVEESKDSRQRPSSLQGLEPQCRNELQGKLMLGIVHEAGVLICNGLDLAFNS